MNTPNPVGWFEIYVTDLPRAIHFYQTVLQTTLTELPTPDGAGGGQMYAFPGDPHLPGAAGALVKHDMGFPSSKGTCIYFSCEDCAVEIGRVEAAGGQVLMAKFPIGDYGFCGVCADSEGNSIGFHSMQ